MWCAEKGAIGMVGFRRYKLLWNGVQFQDGTISCQLMQPAVDAGRPIGLVFRAGGAEFGAIIRSRLDCQRHLIELLHGERSVANAKLPSLDFGQWVSLKVQAQEARIAVTIADSAKPGLQYEDSKPLAGGLVGFDASEARGWFRNLSIESGGKTYVPPLEPIRPAGYRGPVSQWWDPVVTGSADAAFGWDADRPFNSLRSQKIEMRGAKARWVLPTAACTVLGCRWSRAERMRVGCTCAAAAKRPSPREPTAVEHTPGSASRASARIGESSRSS